MDVKKTAYCPEHGYLSTGVVKTDCILKSGILRIVDCQYCKKCKVYYTSSVAALLAKPEPIHGINVTFGKDPGWDMASLVDKCEDKNRQPIAYKPGSIDTYYILDVVYTCPSCCSTLMDTKKNIPIWEKEDGAFHALYTASLSYCHTCHNYYLSSDEAKRIMIEANNARFEPIYEIRPRNGKIRHKPNSNDYQFIEIAHLDIYANVKSSNSHRQSQAEFDLNESSFLRRMGYSLKQPREARHRILENACDEFGKRRVIDHLKMLINMRRNQDKDFTDAIESWNSDIRYLLDVSRR